MDTLKLWIVFSVGVAAGATVALMVAPQAGTKTRKQMKRKLDDAADYTKDQYDDASSYMKEQASNLSEQAAKTYQSTRSAAVDLSENLAGSVRSVVSR